MKTIIFLLLIAFTGAAADSPQIGTNAPPKKVASRWDFKTLTARPDDGTIGPGDSRYDKLIADGWEMMGYDIQPAWVGGVDRPARLQALFRRKKR